MKIAGAEQIFNVSVTFQPDEGVRGPAHVRGVDAHRLLRPLQLAADEGGARAALRSANAGARRRLTMTEQQP